MQRPHMPTRTTKAIAFVLRVPNGGNYTQQNVSAMAGFGVLIKFRFHYIHLSRGTRRNWSALAFRFAALLSPPMPATAETLALWGILYRHMSYLKDILTIVTISTVISSCGQTNNKGQVKIDIDKILKIEDKTTAVIELDTKLNEISNYGGQVERLTESQRTVLFVENLEREINNGGFNQFFFNSSGNFTHETVTALKTIKAFKTADIVSKSISVWPSQNVPKDRVKRQDILQQIEGRANPTWNKCNEEFYKYHDNLVTLLFEFIKSNKSDF